MTGMEMASGGIEPKSADDCFGLGMIFSAGAGVAVDLVEAHKWFNIAAMRGHKDAAKLHAHVARLPQLKEKVKELEKRIRELETKAGDS